jgi:hypothetical protein
MRFRWIEPLYGFGKDQHHIAVPETARAKLLQMGNALAGKENLVAIYIPEGTEDVYEPGNKRGRIVGAVRLLNMPQDKHIEDFAIYDWDQNDANTDWDGSARWPIGWPCRVVLAPSPEQCPTLRTLVEMVHPAATFGSYVAAFQHGPFVLSLDMERAIARWMIRLFGEPPWSDYTD